MTLEEAQAAQANRAKVVGEIFSRLSGQPGFDELMRVMTDMEEQIKEETMNTQDIEGVRWYQAEYAILKQIIKNINNGIRMADEPGSAEQDAT
jgi:hypothetical protein